VISAPHPIPLTQPTQPIPPKWQHRITLISRHMILSTFVVPVALCKVLSFMKGRHFHTYFHTNQSIPSQADWPSWGHSTMKLLGSLNPPHLCNVSWEYDPLRSSDFYQVPVRISHSVPQEKVSIYSSLLPRFTEVMWILLGTYVMVSFSFQSQADRQLAICLLQNAYIIKAFNTKQEGSE